MKCTTQLHENRCILPFFESWFVLLAPLKSAKYGWNGATRTPWTLSNKITKLEPIEPEPKLGSCSHSRNFESQALARLGVDNFWNFEQMHGPGLSIFSSSSIYSTQYQNVLKYDSEFGIYSQKFDWLSLYICYYQPLISASQLPPFHRAPSLSGF